MTYDDYNEYWKPARANLGYRAKIDNFSIAFSARIARVLGVPYSELGDWQEIALTEDMKAKLRLLAGPNGLTVMKAFEAQREQG